MEQTQQTAEQRYQDTATKIFNETGKRPTISQVREVAGGGSFSTISKAMQNWKATPNEDDLSKQNLGLKDLPPELFKKIESLISMVNGLVLESWNIANKDIELAHKKNNEALDMVTKKLLIAETIAAEAKNTMAELAEEADNLTNQLAVEVAEKEELRKVFNTDLIAEAKKSAKAEGRIEELEKKLIGLEG